MAMARTTQKAQKTDWVKMKPEEVEKLVVELGKQNIPPEKIGLILRDQHGLPTARVFNKRIGKILKENNMESNSEYENITRKLEIIKKHIEKHKQDYKTKRALIINAAKLNKVKKSAKK